MANIVSKKTVRKGTKSRVFVVEKIGDKYCVGRYSYGGLDAGWRPFSRLADARKYLDRIVKREKS